MDPATREIVVRRASARCEYCRLPQVAEPLFKFHVEHIIARQHQGSDDLANLALACHHCNLHKGPNLAGIDPVAGSLAALYHPRRDVWREHFESRRGDIQGLTPSGRATARLLAFNAPDRVELREQWLKDAAAEEAEGPT